MNQRDLQKFAEIYAVPDWVRSLERTKHLILPDIPILKVPTLLMENNSVAFAMNSVIAKFNKPLSIFDNKAFEVFLPVTNGIYADRVKPVSDIVRALSYKNILDDIGIAGSSFNQFYEQDIDLWKDFDAKRDSEDGFVPPSELDQKLVMSQYDAVRELITAIYFNNQEMYRLQPRMFEEMIAELLRKDGYIVELTKQTRDGGCDIIALAPMKGLQPVKMLVECKRYAEDRPVGVNFIRSFRDVVQDNGHRGLIVTTSYVTDDAKKRANVNRAPYSLEFKEKNDIIAWVADYLGKPIL